MCKEMQDGEQLRAKFKLRVCVCVCVCVCARACGQLLFSKALCIDR